MREYFPNGMLGLALTGLMAAFMAGVAANVSAFNTVVTYDLVEPYLRRDRSDEYYLRFGRLATIGGIVISSHGADRLGLLEHHELHPGPVLGLQRAAVRDLHHRHVLEADDARGGPVGDGGGSIGALGTYLLYKAGVLDFGSDLAEAFWGAIIAFVLDAIVSVAVTSSPAAAGQRTAGTRLWHGQRGRHLDRGRQRLVPVAALLGVTALILTVALSIFFI